MLPYIRHDMKGRCQSSRVRHYQCQSCGTVHDFDIRCNRRFDVQCPECAKSWRTKVITRIKRGVSNMISPKFVTLTLVKDQSLDLLSIWSLRKSLFRSLRRKGYRIGGWCGVVEAPNHVHMIVDMEYIPQHEMSETWLSVTGHSYIVDIRAIKDSHGERKATNYVSKYLGKSQCWDEANLSLLKGFHLTNNHGLNIEKQIKPCCCDCGIGPLRYVSDAEFDANQSYQIERNDLT